MTDNVVRFPGNGNSPQDLMEKMIEAGVEQCVVIGFSEGGSVVLGTTSMEVSEAIFALKVAEKVMMESVL